MKKPTKKSILYGLNKLIYKVSRLVNLLIDSITAEWVFKLPIGNGGGLVVFRSAFTAALIYLFSIYMLHLAGDAGFKGEYSADLSLHLKWYGAVFAATYAAFYARFSSQWNYLADLYNQIKSKQIDIESTGNTNIGIYEWWAAFIEDAEDLHLALKKNYAMSIWESLNKKEVAENFIDHTENGEARFMKLVGSLGMVLDRSPEEVANLRNMHKKA